MIAIEDYYAFTTAMLSTVVTCSLVGWLFSIFTMALHKARVNTIDALRIKKKLITDGEFLMLSFQADFATLAAMGVFFIVLLYLQFLVPYIFKCTLWIYDFDYKDSYHPDYEECFT